MSIRPSLKILNQIYSSHSIDSKSVNTTIQNYIYDGSDIIAITDSSNNPISMITHDESIDTPLSIKTNNQSFYYQRDHQGSILNLTDESQNKVEEYTYTDAYGSTVKTQTINTNNPYAYTGREYDDEDLYYYRARYYDPSTQRFLSEDPIGYNSGDFNFYRYVGNSPSNFVDPSGEFAIFLAPLIAPEGVSALLALAAGLLATANEYDKNNVFDDCEDATYYIPPPNDISDLFPDAKSEKSKNQRKRWRDKKKGEIYEWDSQHGDLEIYNKQGKHKGSINLKTGQTKPKAPGRKTHK